MSDPRRLSSSGLARPWAIAAVFVWGFCLVTTAQLALRGGVQLFEDSELFIQAADYLLASEAPITFAQPYIAYSALIAASKWLGLGLAGVVAFQLGCALLALFALFRLGSHLRGPTAGVVAAALAVVNIHASQWHISILTDSLYASVVTLVAWTGYEAKVRGGRWRWIFLVLVGLAGLIRPTGWFLVPAAFCWLVVPRFKGGLARTAVVLGTLLVFVGAVLAIPVTRERLEAADPVAKIQGGVVIGDGVWTLEMPDPSNGGTGVGAAALYVVEHPLASLRLFGARIVAELMRGRRGFGFWVNVSIAVWLLPLYALAIVGARKVWGHPLAPWLALLVVVHLVFIALAFSSWHARFISYIEPLLGLFAAVSLSDILIRPQQR